METVILWMEKQFMESGLMGNEQSYPSWRRGSQVENEFVVLYEDSGLMHEKWSFFEIVFTETVISGHWFSGREIE